MGRDLDHYQLSELIVHKSRKSLVCKEIQDEMNFTVGDDDLNSISLLNKCQFAAFKAITDAVSEGKSMAFFIDGPGGTGKTFLYRAILAAIRSQDKIALATASSGVAASILPNGRTVHSRFKIPIIGDEKLCCNVGKQSGLAKLLRDTALIIWDEASMAKKQSIEALDDLMRDLTGNDTLFGGKIVVLGGDFRQVLPVIPRGTKDDCMNASLVRSYIWPALTKFKLEQNMRAKTDPAFSDYILQVGDGVEPENEKGQVRIPNSLIITLTSTQTNLDDLINFVFPTFTASAADPLSITNSAILTPKNSAVDEINETMMSKFPGEDNVYLSFNETVDSSQQGLYIDFLNSICPVGMPAHRLVLKKHCPIVLLRNINPSKGLCNGTRLICLDFQPHIIVAQIAVGEKKGDVDFIPRITLQPNDRHLYPVEFSRHQFPIRVCFTMAINKAQGQTLNTVGVYLPEPVFAHGQLYVALSRATTASKIRVQLTDITRDPLSPYFTVNIVYKDLLSEAHNV